MTTNERTVGRYLRWVLAALSLGAGVIHFSVSGEHYSLSWMHGAFFAATAWLQVAWAIGVILRPTRRLLVAGVVLNAGIALVWVVSRVWGVPIGPDAWTPEAATFIDQLSTGFEVGIVALSLAVLVRPALASPSLRRPGSRARRDRARAARARRPDVRAEAESGAGRALGDARV